MVRGGAGASAKFDLEKASQTLWKELHLQIPPVQDTEEERVGK